jgi:hypothetical protein
MRDKAYVGSLRSKGTVSEGSEERSQRDGAHLSGSVPDGGLSSNTGSLNTLALEDVNGGLGATHVGSLSDESDTGGNERLGLLSRDLVLGCARKSDIEGLEVCPGTCTWRIEKLEHGTREGREILYRQLTLNILEAIHDSELNEVSALELKLADLGDKLGGEASRAGGEEGTLGVGERDDGSSKLDDLERSILLSERTVSSAQMILVHESRH